MNGTRRCVCLCVPVRVTHHVLHEVVDTCVTVPRSCQLLWENCGRGGGREGGREGKTDSELFKQN